MYHKVLRKIARTFLGKFYELRNWSNILLASDQCTMARGVRIIGDGVVRNFHGPNNAIKIGANTVILGELCAFCSGATIEIGEDTYIGPRSNIMAFASIKIGSRVQISHGVNIYDNNSHSTSGSLRFTHMKTILTKGHPPVVEDLDRAPIVIEDDVWIGFGAIILKGVHIQRGAIIGAGSIITKNVAAYAKIVGNPPRQIGESRG